MLKTTILMSRSFFADCRYLIIQKIIHKTAREYTKN